MTDKRKKRARDLSKRTGMSYQAASNVLAGNVQTPIEGAGLLGFYRGEPIVSREEVYQGGEHSLTLRTLNPSGNYVLHKIIMTDPILDSEKRLDLFSTEYPLSALKVDPAQRVQYEVFYTRMMLEAEKRGEPKPLYEMTLRALNEIEDLFQILKSSVLNVPMWQRSRPDRLQCGIEFGSRVTWFPITLLKGNEIPGFGEWYLALPKGEAVFNGDIPMPSVKP